MSQVATKLVVEAESNIGKKEHDANDGLIRHSDATKIQVNTPNSGLVSNGGNQLPCCSNFLSCLAIRLSARQPLHMHVAPRPNSGVIGCACLLLQLCSSSCSQLQTG